MIPAKWIYANLLQINENLENSQSRPLSTDQRQYPGKQRTESYRLQNLGGMWVANVHIRSEHNRRSGKGSAGPIAKVMIGYSLTL